MTVKSWMEKVADEYADQNTHEPILAGQFGDLLTR